jgi:myo-inositol-1(or 4)-monophosphatase
MNQSQNTRTEKDLNRVVEALDAAGAIYRSTSPENMNVQKKTGGDPVTDAELRANQLLHEMLVEEGDGWLSEESVDNARRLCCSRVWLVDPLDGTKEYVAQIPEWCISIALMEGDEFVAAGIFNPQTDELIYGSPDIGVVCRSGLPLNAAMKIPSDGPVVLASRSEVNRGLWGRFDRQPFLTRPMGSVAYKLALVAAGNADATWTLVPKNEWDVAAGIALLQFAGGRVLTTDGLPPRFNRKQTLFPGLIGFSKTGLTRLRPFLKSMLEDNEFQDCRPWARPLAAVDSEAVTSSSTPVASLK